MTPEKRKEMEQSIEKSRARAAAVGKTLEMPNDVFTAIRADGHRYMVMDMVSQGIGYCVALVPPANWDFEVNPLSEYIVKANCHCFQEAAALAGKWGEFDPRKVHLIRSI